MIQWESEKAAVISKFASLRLGNFNFNRENIWKSERFLCVFMWWLSGQSNLWNWVSMESFESYTSFNENGSSHRQPETAMEISITSRGNTVTARSEMLCYAYSCMYGKRSQAVWRCWWTVSTETGIENCISNNYFRKKMKSFINIK